MDPYSYRLDYQMYTLPLDHHHLKELPGPDPINKATLVLRILIGWKNTDSQSDCSKPVAIVLNKF